MNSYQLSRDWFNYCFENPHKIKPIHTAIYFFAIEHCNRLGWKEKFGFPSQMVMEALGIKNWRTYSKALNEIVEFGFIDMIEISKNQYSSNIIAIVKNTKAHTKALDKALSKHSQKHSQKQGQSTVSIDKQETSNKETNIYTSEIPDFDLFLDYAKEKKPNVSKNGVKLKYEAWKLNGWKDGNDNVINNWRLKLLHTLPHIKETKSSNLNSNGSINKAQMF